MVAFATVTRLVKSPATGVLATYLYYFFSVDVYLY